MKRDVGAKDYRNSGDIQQISGGLRISIGTAGQSAARSAAVRQAIMIAREALDAANAEPGERLRRHETVCGPRGTCRRGPLANDPGRWTCCPDCLTVYDHY